MPREEKHMSWCVGRHDGWDCIIKTVLPFGDRSQGFESVIAMVGVPCDHLRVDVEPAHAVLINVADVDAYLQHLADVAAELKALRDRLAASTGEDDCDNHDHDD